MIINLESWERKLTYARFDFPCASLFTPFEPSQASSSLLYRNRKSSLRSTATQYTSLSSQLSSHLLPPLRSHLETPGVIPRLNHHHNVHSTSEQNTDNIGDPPRALAPCDPPDPACPGLLLEHARHDRHADRAGGRVPDHDLAADGRVRST